MESDTTTRAPGGDAGRRSPWGRWLPRLKPMVPTLAVVTVVVAALAATVMVTRDDWQEANRPAVLGKTGRDVVRAPPLVVRAPPLAKSDALGAGPACRNCGVVEAVAPLEAQGGFQMRVRMDDGSTRTVEQRGAVPAGSRVLLERGSLRVMPLRTGQG
ncbi:MAG: hypothetical protein NDJ19_04980 [Ramlibacter sp.]|nr:hypothetical protein [Ramlibacter sp.]